MSIEIYDYVRTSCQTLCVPLPKKLYKRTRRARTIDEVEEEYFPGFKAFSILLNKRYQGQRTKERRKSYYSGRKKKHTVKTQLMVNTEGLILHKTGHRNGRKHDYEIFKHNHPTITPISTVTTRQLQASFKIQFGGYRICQVEDGVEKRRPT